MLTATLVFLDGTRVPAELPPARAYPPFVSLAYGDVIAKVFSRRGSSVGNDCDVFDEVTPVPVFVPASPVPNGE